MLVSPLNLISTPVPVLNSLGLDLRAGLSSEDPMGGRLPSEAYEAYLSIYSPEGLLMERQHLGQIPAERRRYFRISDITRNQLPAIDHLTVIHRVPTSLGIQLADVAKEIELPIEPDYSMFRALVEFGYPEGGSASLIYETPPGLNAGPSSNSLSFTCQMVLSELIDTHVVLINYSTDPSYSRIAHYSFGVFSLAGERLASEDVAIAPFGIKVMDLSQVIPKEAAAREMEKQDGLAAFTFVGYSNDAALIMMTLNTSPALRSVSVEHTHPPQTYLFPSDISQRSTLKSAAQRSWDAILAKPGAKR